jgi:hypothetical protein
MISSSRAFSRVRPTGCLQPRDNDRPLMPKRASHASGTLFTPAASLSRGCGGAGMLIWPHAGAGVVQRTYREIQRRYFTPPVDDRPPCWTSNAPKFEKEPKRAF